MKKLSFIALQLSIILLFSALGALAQTSNIVKTDLSQTEIDQNNQRLYEKRIQFSASFGHLCF